MTDRGMAVWTLALLLAACGAILVRANSVEFIEGPVLLPSCSASQTVVRCSIEVDGIVTPRIDFYINGELSRNYGYLRCNSEDVQRYVLENNSVPKTCTVNDTAGETRRRLHQTMFIRTCPSDPSSFSSIVIQCIVHSDAVPAVNGNASKRMNLTYNERLKPRLDPQPGEFVMFLDDPVCPGEDLGIISLESQTSPFPSRCTTSTAGPITETPIPTSPPGTQTSVTPTPSSSSPPPLTTSSGLLTKGQLMLIIYIATGVAAFFALLVVCLIFMLCCIVTKKHRMQKAVPLRQGRKDVGE